MIAGARGRLVPWWRVAALPVLAIVLALAIAGVIIVVSSAFTGIGFFPLLPLYAYGNLFAGAFGSGIALNNTLVAAAPLMLGGLAIGLGFKAGLFNIGVAGQFLAGAFASAVVGSSLASAPAPVAVGLALLAGGFAGAVLGAIPGFLKARTRS